MIFLVLCYSNRKSIQGHTELWCKQLLRLKIDKRKGCSHLVAEQEEADLGS